MNDPFEDDVLTSQELHLIDEIENRVVGVKRQLPASFKPPTNSHDLTKRPQPPGSRPTSATSTLVCSVKQRYCISTEEVEYSIQELLDNPPPVVGFDIEWRVTYQTGVRPRPVALIQLCTRDLCLLLHIAHSGMTPLLQRFLTTGTIFKAGVGAHGDALKIGRDYGFAMEGTVDLSEFANTRLGEGAGGPKKWSLTALTQQVLGKRLPKTQSLRCSNWEAMPLTGEQREYATVDAWASFLLYEALAKMPVIDHPIAPAAAVDDYLASPTFQGCCIPPCTSLNPLQPAKLAVLQLHHQGHSIAHIAEQRKVQQDTVQAYLAEAILAGYGYRLPLLGLTSSVVREVGWTTSRLLSCDVFVPVPAQGDGPQDAVSDLLTPMLASGIGIRVLKETHFEGVGFGELRVCLAHLGRYNQQPPDLPSTAGDG